LKGARGIASLPAIILMSAFVGFLRFCRRGRHSAWRNRVHDRHDLGLPAKVLLVGSILAGASLPAAFITVALSSIRLMPMVAALIPEIRTEKTPTWLSAVAVAFHRDHRLCFHHGAHPRRAARASRGLFRRLRHDGHLGQYHVLVAVIYSTVANLPAMVAGALFFLTPVYFLTSIWASTRDRAGHIAMIIGLALGPLFHQVAPEFDILYAGVVGGTLAFFADRVWNRREGK
jgi:hypothetical protein